MSLYRDFKYEWLRLQVKNINLLGFFFFYGVTSEVFIHHQRSVIKFHFFHVCPISNHCWLFFSAQSSWQDYKLWVMHREHVTMVGFFFYFVGQGEIILFICSSSSSVLLSSILVLLCSWAWPSSLVKLGPGGFWAVWEAAALWVVCRQPPPAGPVWAASTHSCWLSSFSMPEHHVSVFLSLGVTWLIMNLFGLCFVFLLETAVCLSWCTTLNKTLSGWQFQALVF